MNTLVLPVLKVVLWFVCGTHILLGASIMLSGRFQQQAAILYGAHVDWTPQFVYMLRPLGAFMFMLGVVGVAAALNPVRYRVIGYGFVGLLLIRVLQRIVFRSDIEQVFQIGSARNLANAAFFFVIAAVLAVLLYLAGKRETPAAA